MTVPEVMDLQQYWRRQPPTHELVAAALGWKPPSEKQAAPPSLADLQAQVALMNGGPGK